MLEGGAGANGDHSGYTSHQRMGLQQRMRSRWDHGVVLHYRISSNHFWSGHQRSKPHGEHAGPAVVSTAWTIMDANCQLTSNWWLQHRIILCSLSSLHMHKPRQCGEMDHYNNKQRTLPLVMPCAWCCGMWYMCGGDKVSTISSWQRTMFYHK